MNLKRRYEPEDSCIQQLFSAGDGISKIIDFGILLLDKEEIYKSNSTSKEIALIILSGKCSIKVGDKEFNSIGERKSVFDGRVYTGDCMLDETYTMHNNEAVFIPKGYHPVATAPGYNIYYMWVLFGEKRKAIPVDDPQHTWVKEI